MCITNKNDADLYIGYAKVNITPDYPVNLAGYGDNETRFSEGVASNIYATCIAATSGEETILVYTVDNLGVARDFANAFRKDITAATGISGEKIFFGGTHGHNCPDLNLCKQYLTDLKKRMVEAARQALADQAPAAVFAATRQIEGMNYARHYRNSDGSCFGSNFGKKIDIAGHVGNKDSTLLLVKFERTAPKKDVLLINWQAHPDSHSEIGHYLISATWPGELRDTVTDATGMEVAYFTGASGNTNKDSRIPAEKDGLTWRQYGEKMGRYVISSLDLLAPVEGTEIKSTRVIFDAPINHDWDHMLEQANEIYDMWKGTDEKPGDKSAATEKAIEAYDFTSVYQARMIRQRVTMGKTMELELNAFSIGSIGFTTGTYEMFGGSSLYVREHSPFDFTVVITGNRTYIPTQDAYDYRCYEADTGLYARGTAEALDRKYVQMLKSLK